MNSSTSIPAALCARCGRSLDGPQFDGVCPACLWTDVFSEPVDELAATPNPLPAAPGLVPVPGHEVQEELARGGMGIVYRARQFDPPRTVALKMLLPHRGGSEPMRARFRIEAQAIAALDHPAILPVFQVGEQDGLPWFTMKLARGGSLAARRAEFSGRWREIAGLVATLADAVQFAHERGVLHRDLKPGNILFDEAGRPFVSDFGLAKVLGSDSDLTRSVDFLGTPHYAAPEVAAGSARQATTASDLYSLGAILYELLAGRPPFEAEGVPALLKKVAEEEPGRPLARKSETRTGMDCGSVSASCAADDARETALGGAPQSLRLEHQSTITAPQGLRRSDTGNRFSGFGLRVSDLETICLKCLAKDPSRRYAAARDLAEDLRRWLDGQPILARPATRLERLQSWTRRNPALAAVTAVLLLVIASAGLALWERNRRLEGALRREHAAQLDSQQRLRQALLAGACNARDSGRAGRREQALAAVRSAANILVDAAVRSEAAAALAVTDLVPRRPLLRYFANGFSTFDLPPDLGRYAHGTSNGFIVRRCDDDQPLHRVVHTDGTPGHRFRFSPDGTRLAVTSLDGRIAVWDWERETPVWTAPGFDGQPVAVAFHPRRPAFAFATRGHAVIIRDEASGAEQGLVSAGAPVRALAFHPRGEHLVVVRADGTELRTVENGEFRWTMPGSFPAAAVAWSPDGERLAITGGARHEIVIHTAQNGALERVLNGHQLPVLALEFHPSGRLLASVGQDRVLRLWDVGSGLPTLETPAAPRGLRWSADGRQLAFAPGHFECAIFDYVTSTVWRDFSGAPDTPASLGAIDVSTDGRWLATLAGGEVQLRETESGRVLGAFPFRHTDQPSVFFHPDGRSVIGAARGSGMVRREFTVRGVGGNSGVEWGPAQSLEASGDAFLWNLGPGNTNWLVGRANPNQIAIWPAGSVAGEKILVTDRRANDVALSPDGRWLGVAVAPVPGVMIWDVQSGRLAHEISPAGHAAIGFSPDGRWLLTGTDAEYQLWDTGRWQAGPRWPANLAGQGRGCLAFSPDGRMLATVEDGASVTLRDTVGYEELLRLAPPVPLRVERLAWPPDGTRLYLLGAGHRVCEWNLATLRRELAQSGLDWK